MRVSDQDLKNLIQNDGMVRPGTLPNAMGVLRLALDLQEARQKIEELEERLEEQLERFEQLELDIMGDRSLAEGGG